MYDVTFDGLHCWNKSLFEKLGWMVLVHSQGQNKSVTDCYIVEIKNLMNAIQDKISKMMELNCPDKAEDLNIMLRNLDILLKHVKKDFNEKYNLSEIKQNPNNIHNIGNLNMSGINPLNNNLSLIEQNSKSVHTISNMSMSNQILEGGK